MTTAAHEKQVCQFGRPVFHQRLKTAPFKVLLLLFFQEKEGSFWFFFFQEKELRARLGPALVLWRGQRGHRRHQHHALARLRHARQPLAQIRGSSFSSPQIICFIFSVYTRLSMKLAALITACLLLAVKIAGWRDASFVNCCIVRL